MYLNCTNSFFSKVCKILEFYKHFQKMKFSSENLKLHFDIIKNFVRPGLG